MEFPRLNHFLLAASVALSSAAFSAALPHEAGAAMYICPGKNGETLDTKLGPGCRPLFEQRTDEEKKPSARPRAANPVKPENLEAAVLAFKAKYNEFLNCCAADPATGKDIDDLENEASEILQTAEVLVGQRFALAASHGALVLPVAQAREKLRALRKEHKRLDQAYDKMENSDTLEEAGRERRRIAEDEAAIERNFQPAKQPSRAPTGKDVGNSDLDQQSRTGPALSGTSSFNRDAAVGAESGRNSTLNNAARTGTPAVGNSDMNQRSETGSALSGESTFNNSSRIGKDLENSSSFNKGSNTGPSVGNSDLNQR